MKQQIERLSPHQNGKVFAVLMAASNFMYRYIGGIEYTARSDAL